MKKSLSIVRFGYILLCLFGSYLVWYTHPKLHPSHTLFIFLSGLTFGFITVFMEANFKAITLKNITAITFALALSMLFTWLLSISPLLENLSNDLIFYVKMGTFLSVLYLGTVLAIKDKDNLTCVIPFLRFIPYANEQQGVLIDTSVLIDGRIATLCQSRFLSSTLIIPKFVVEELQRLASSEDLQQKANGKKGIEILNKLKNMNYIDLRIQDFSVKNTQEKDSQVVYLAQALKTKLMTTDYNLAKLAEFHGIEWLNLNALSKALNPEVIIGQYLDVDLIKKGKEEHQGVGYLSDGSMVVVNEAVEFIGKTVAAEVINVLPSTGGKMIFARLHARPAEAA